MKFLLMAWMVALPFLTRSQDTGERSNQGEERERHSLGLAIGHAQAFEGRNEHNERKTLALPCWSLDYNYHINSEWIIGLHTDFILEKFRVEDSSEGEFTERSYPIAPAVVGMYSLSRRWKVQLGTGVEFAKEENIFLLRVGVEYSVELPKEWEVFGSLVHDIKWDTYSTLAISMGISRRLGR